MKFVKVKELPKRRKNSILIFLDEFMTSNIKFAKVEFSEKDYKTPSSCQSAFSKAIKAGGFPIIVKSINKEVYLIRTDM